MYSANPRLLSISVSVAVFWLLVAGISSAQVYPTKPIRLIVPNTPGSIADVISRIMVPEMSKYLAQPIVVENKAGAGGIVGYEYVAKQVAPDGYTIVSANPSTLASYPLMVKNLRFDPMKDLPPIISTVEGRTIFGSSSKAPWKTFNEFVAYAKANPGKLNYGTASALQQLTTAAILVPFGVDAVHVPYSAAAAYYNDLVGGVVIGVASASAATSFGDKFQALAVTGTKRHPSFPAAPTFEELGHPYIFGSTNSMNMPVGTPPVAIEKLHAAATHSLRQPQVISLFESNKLEILGGTREEAARQLAALHQMFSELVKKLGIEPQ